MRENTDWETLGEVIGITEEICIRTIKIRHENGVLHTAKSSTLSSMCIVTVRPSVVGSCAARSEMGPP